MTAALTSGPRRPSRPSTRPRSRCSRGPACASSRRPPGTSSWRPAARRARRPRADPAAGGRGGAGALPRALRAGGARPCEVTRASTPSAGPDLRPQPGRGPQTSSTRAPASSQGDPARPGARDPRHAPSGEPAPGDVPGSRGTCPTCSSRSTRTSSWRWRPTRRSADRASPTRSRPGTSRRWRRP